MGLALLVLTTLFVVAYYVNNPEAQSNPDTASYLDSARRIMAGGHLVDQTRLPGYPLLMALVFSFAGFGDIAALSVAQAVLYVAAAVEIYVVAYLISRRSWVALVVALIAGVNTYQLSYSKPGIVEGVMLWLVASLTLAVVLFVRNVRPLQLWLVAGILLATFMTRPEWVYAPLPLFAFMLVVAWRQGLLRKLLPHALGAVVGIYAVLGIYVAINAAHNDYPGITYVERINLLGKVMQYDMQDEAPSRYREVTNRLDRFLARSETRSPYEFAVAYPPIAREYWKLANDYSLPIVFHHPFRYVRETVPVFVHSSSRDLRPLAQIDGDGRFGWELRQLQRAAGAVHNHFYVWFPLIALCWLLGWLALLIRRQEVPASVELMAAVSLLGLYELVVISLGGYVDYMRLQIPMNPLRIVVIFGSLLLAGAFVADLAAKRLVSARA